MIKNRKPWIIIIITSLMLILGGCQLAVEEGTENTVEDRLIGALITTGSLNPVVMNHDILPEMFEEMEDGELMMDDFLEMEGGVVIASPSYDEKKFIFEGVEGFSMFSATMYMENENESYSTSQADDGISDVSTHITAGDTDKIEMKGTIYFSQKTGERVWYMNPVYQKKNGVVYAVPGSGFGMGGELGEGTEGSTKIDQALSYTVNGTTKSFESFIEIRYVFMYAPTKIVVVEMDENNKVLIRREFEPGKLPEELETNDEAEYLIIETQKTGEDGETVVERQIIDHSEETFSTFYQSDDSILTKMSTNVIWR